MKSLVFGLSVALAFPCAAANAQEQEDPHDELIRLVGEIEQTLEVVDDHLADAGAGEVKLAEVPDARLEDLLRHTLSRSESIVTAIDRIFEIEAHHEGGGGT